MTMNKFKAAKRKARIYRVRVNSDPETEFRAPPMRDCVVTFERPDGTSREVIVKASHCIHRMILRVVSKNALTTYEDEHMVVVLDDRGSEVPVPGMKPGERIIRFHPIARM